MIKPYHIMIFENNIHWYLF